MTLMIFGGLKFKDNLIGRKNSSEKTFKKYRLKINPPIHPFNNTKITKVKPSIHNHKTRRTLAIGLLT